MMIEEHELQKAKLKVKHVDYASARARFAYEMRYRRTALKPAAKRLSTPPYVKPERRLGYQFSQKYQSKYVFQNCPEVRKK